MARVQGQGGVVEAPRRIVGNFEIVNGIVVPVDRVAAVTAVANVVVLVGALPLIEHGVRAPRRTMGNLEIVNGI